MNSISVRFFALAPTSARQEGVRQANKRKLLLFPFPPFYVCDFDFIFIFLRMKRRTERKEGITGEAGERLVREEKGETPGVKL